MDYSESECLHFKYLSIYRGVLIPPQLSRNTSIEGCGRIGIISLLQDSNQICFANIFAAMFLCANMRRVYSISTWKGYRFGKYFMINNLSRNRICNILYITYHWLMTFYKAMLYIMSFIHFKSKQALSYVITKSRCISSQFFCLVLIFLLPRPSLDPGNTHACDRAWLKSGQKYPILLQQS